MKKDTRPSFALGFIGSLLAVSAVICIVFLCQNTVVHAQTANGSINGMVRDAKGASVSGAHVAARNVATNLTRTSTSDADGAYHLLELPVGSYEVTAEASGFEKLVRPNIELLVWQP